MTEKEARIFLSMEVGDDPQDAMDEVLFQFKKFFTSQAIIRSMFQAKLKKLEKIKEAGEVFGIKHASSRLPERFELKETEEMVLLFQEFQNSKSQLFLAINSCNDPKDLDHLVVEIVDLQSSFNAHWPEIKNLEETVILAKQPDPMDVLMDLKKLKEIGVETFQDLTKVQSFEKNCIGLESQRLYLLHQKELQWKKMSSLI